MKVIEKGINNSDKMVIRVCHLRIREKLGNPYLLRTICLKEEKEVPIYAD
jgi:hypothetical protein